MIFNCFLWMESPLPQVGLDNQRLRVWFQRRGHFFIYSFQNYLSFKNNIYFKLEPESYALIKLCKETTYKEKQDRLYIRTSTYVHVKKCNARSPRNTENYIFLFSRKLLIGNIVLLKFSHFLQIFTASLLLFKIRIYDIKS